MDAVRANRRRIARAEIRLGGGASSEGYIDDSVGRAEEDGSFGNGHVDMLGAAHPEHESGSSRTWWVGVNGGVGRADRERTVRVVSDLDQGFAADQLNLAPSVGQPGPDLAVCVELDGAAICQGDVLVAANTGRIRYPIGPSQHEPGREAKKIYDQT